MKLDVIRRYLLLIEVYLITVSCLEIVAAEQSCTANTRVPGVCVGFRQCPVLNKYVSHHPVLALGAIVTSVCSFGLFKIMVCCPVESNHTPTTTLAPPSIEGTLQIIVEDEPSSERGSYEALLPPDCGHSDAPHDRVIGGNEAALNAWPWMAALYFRFGKEPHEITFCCGGSLISSRHVVTAAHCLEFEEVTYEVRLGVHDLKKTDDGADPINVTIESYVIHPEYNSTLKENDIAVLKMDRDVEFSKAIHPICLPIKASLRNRNFVNTYPFVAGWGTTSYGGGDISSVLEEVQVPVVANQQCKKDYKAKQVEIDEKVLCAGWPNGGKDACQGDSGGPLMWPERTTYYLIGVVSTGWKCAEAGFPGIYTRVTRFLDFIVSNLR